MSENENSARGEATNDSEPTLANSIHSEALEALQSQAQGWDINFGEIDAAAMKDGFFDGTALESDTILDSYWVNEPFAYVAAVFDEDVRDHRYHIFEPELSPAEMYVREDLDRIVRNVWRDQGINQLTDADGRLSASAIRHIIDTHAAHVPALTAYKLYYYLLRDFVRYGPIDPIMSDSAIEDISCDGYETPVFVYHRDHRDLPTNRAFDKEFLDTLVVRLGQRAGDHLTRSTPRGGGALPDGSRIQLTLGADISSRGSNFTIRKFQDVPLSPIDLIAWNTFSVDQMAYLWLAIENNKSVIFVGPTASGKTTSMNAVSLFLPPNRKVVTVEQVRELSIPHDNWIASVTRQTTRQGGMNAVGMYDLLQDALHQRPEYLLVGEIRTEPEVVRTFFHSVFTGHPGGTTFHAKDTESAVDRLMSEPLNVPERMVNAIDIISVQRQVFLEEKRVRRNYEISEVAMSDSRLQTTPLFEWDPPTDSFDHAADLYGDSTVLRDIAEERGWDEFRINEELYRRRTILQYLLTHGFTDYQDVISTFYLFARDREYLLEQLQEGRLDPTEVNLT